MKWIKTRSNELINVDSIAYIEITNDPNLEFSCLNAVMNNNDRIRLLVTKDKTKCLVEFNNLKLFVTGHIPIEESEDCDLYTIKIYNQ